MSAFLVQKTKGTPALALQLCAPARALLVAHTHRAAAPVVERSQCRRAAPLGDETSAPEDAHQEHSHSTAALLGPIGWVC